MRKFLSTIPLFGVSGLSSHNERVNGAGEKNLMVIYTAGDNPAADRDYLEKILNAVGINLENDTFHLEVGDRYGVAWAPLKRQYQVRYCLLFGVAPGDAGIRINMTKYQPSAYQEVTYLCADSLEKIRLAREAGDNRAAGALWKALLEIFPKV